MLLHGGVDHGLDRGEGHHDAAEAEQLAALLSFNGYVVDSVDKVNNEVSGHYSTRKAGDPHVDESGSGGNHDDFLGAGTHGHSSHNAMLRASAPPPAGTTTLTYFIHNHGGDDEITSDQFARIRDAAAVWNAAGAAVRLNEVFTDAEADIHVHNDSTSGCGSNVLGCAETTFTGGHDGSYDDGHPLHRMLPNTPGTNTRQELTMISDVGGAIFGIGNGWYEQSDPGGFFPDEFDYMSVVIQEFGHHLGLAHPNETGGHSSAETNASPMNGSLPSNTVRRTLQASDKAAVIHLYGDDGDFNDRLRDANATAVGASITDFMINIPIDVDMWSFSVSAGQRVGFDIDTPGSDLDAYLRIFDGSGTQLAFDDDDTNMDGPAPEDSTRDPYLEHTFTSAGTYYVGVSGFNNSSYNAVSGEGDVAATTTGDFELHIRDLSASRFVVTETGDGGDSIVSNGVTLREAIGYANGVAGANTISFDPTVFAAPATVNVTNGQIAINDSLTIQGRGADRLTISANDNSRIFVFGGGGAKTYEVHDVTLAQGTTNGDGGAVYMTDTDDTLRFFDAALRDNVATLGGAAFMIGGTLEMTNVEVSDNEATQGGGLNLQNVNSTLTNVTLSGNSASNRGGAILNWRNGAGTSTLNLFHSTLANNTSPSGAAIRHDAATGTAVARYANTLFGENHVGNNITGFNFSGGTTTLTSLGYNLSDDTTGNLNATGDISNLIAKVKPLDNNGGPTRTHGLLLNSAAVDGGDPAFSAPPSTDQRGPGFARVLGGRIDIGAFESRPAVNVGQLSLGGSGVVGVPLAEREVVFFRFNLPEDVTAADGDFLVINTLGSEITGLSRDNDTEIGLYDSFGDFIVSNDDFMPFPNGESQLVFGSAPAPGAGQGGGGPDLPAGDYVIALGAFDTTFGGLDFNATSTSTGSGSAALNFQLQQGTFVVGTTDDELDADLTPNDLSLREAISLANANPSFTNILFDPAVFGTAQTIDLTLGELLITKSLAIHGPGADLLTIDAANSSRVFSLDDGVTGDIKDVSISGLTATRGNGTVANGRGGAIHSLEKLTLDGVTISDSNTSVDGGGIWARYGDLTISNSTISGNGSSFKGGGIYSRNNTAELSNSTVSGNTSNNGAGVYLRGDGVLTSTTISNNSSNSLFIGAASTTQLTYTIVANSFGGADIVGTIDADFSLIETTGGATINGAGNLLGVDPNLGSLADNGGPTQTHALLTGSLAIDVVAAGAVPEFDQRGSGFPRVADGDDTPGALLDIGAYELQQAFLEADFDKDGDVDGEDFLAWQSGFGITSGASQADGDADGDGDVDGEDFLLWQTQFGSGIDGSGSLGADSGESNRVTATPRTAARDAVFGISSRRSDSSSPLRTRLELEHVFATSDGFRTR